MEDTRSGFIAIVGKPNVGKSTLLNSIIGEKVSITSPKVQTTRHTILGVKTKGNKQAVYVDTPGMHLGYKKQLNQFMNKAAQSALKDVDVVLCLLDSLKISPDDEKVLSLLETVKAPVILAINKIDLIKDKAKMLPFVERVSKRMEFIEIIPISVEKNHNIDKLQELVMERLPEGPFYYSESSVTDKSENFRVAELIREKLMLGLSEELPYSSTVSIEDINKESKNKEGNLIVKIYATIWVERDSQKSIVIGEGGLKIKELGTRARLALEYLYKEKVFLDVRVKVKNSWADDERAMLSLGYNLD